MQIIINIQISIIYFLGNSVFKYPVIVLNIGFVHSLLLFCFISKECKLLKYNELKQEIFAKSPVWSISDISYATFDVIIPSPSIALYMRADRSKPPIKNIHNLSSSRVEYIQKSSLPPDAWLCPAFFPCKYLHKYASGLCEPRYREVSSVKIYGNPD